MSAAAVNTKPIVQVNEGKQAKQAKKAKETPKFTLKANFGGANLYYSSGNVRSILEKYDVSVLKGLIKGEKEQVAEKIQSYIKKWDQGNPFSLFAVLHNRQPVGFIDFNETSSVINISCLGTDKFSEGQKKDAIKLIFKTLVPEVNKQKEAQYSSKRFSMTLDPKEKELAKTLESLGFKAPKAKTEEEPKVYTRTFNGKEEVWGYGRYAMNGLTFGYWG